MTLGLLFGLTVASAATIELQSTPEQGVETVIAVTDAEGGPRRGETVRVVHRPGVEGERELAIGITDGRGRVRWTPELPGVATVRAGDERTRVHITGAEPPHQVILVVVLLLLGSAACVGFGLTR